MIDYNLNDEELEQIQWGMHHSAKVEVRQRATALHLLHRGQLPEEVSKMLAVSLGSIYNWHHRWRRQGLEGLKNKTRSGRPKNANAAYCQLLEEVIERLPSEYGYAFGN